MVIKIIIVVVGLIFIAAFGYGSHVFRRRLQLLRSTELVDIADLEEGKAKATGEVVAAEKLIRAPFSGAKCVWYSVSVEEEREYQESYTTHEGNRRVTRTRTRTEYKNIFLDVQFIAFQIQDQTGEAEIAMEGAETYVKSSDRKHSGKMRDLSARVLDRLGDFYPDHPEIRSKRCRYVELRIEEGDTLLALGEVSLSKNSPPLFASEKKKPLIVADQSDEQLQKSFKRTSIWLAIAAGGFLVATILGAIFLGGK